MKRVLCFGDSNTYGYDAITNGRFDENTRWTCLLQKMAGSEYTIIEEGLSGRTTCYQDPINEGMSGMDYLYPCLMSHGPFDTLILMLGTNDCKERYSATPKNIADGMKRLVEKAKTLPVWTNEPDIIVISPAPILKECESSWVSGEMGICSDKSYHLAEEYKAMAEMEQIRFLDAAGLDMNTIDYMHLSAKGHADLAEMIWKELTCTGIRKRKMTKKELLDAVHGQIIISCQAVKGEPLYVEEKSVMYLMARAAKQAGTHMIRTSSIRDVIAIKKETELPVIGLVKIHYEGYESYITPTMKEVDDLVAAGADIVALDCTMRKRGDGTTINEFLAQIRAKYPEIILMADISTYEEGINAEKCGVDIVGTTMSGYTAYTEAKDEPDYELMRRLAADLNIPVIGEGKIHSPEEAVKALDTGVWAIVVGGAITRPLEIAQRFMKAVEQT